MIFQYYFNKNVLGNGDAKSYKVTLCSLDDEEFRDFHSRFQTFIVFYIDAASYIDLSDKKWTVYYVYVYHLFLYNRITFFIFRYETGKKSCYPIGFCTVYNFFSYPDKIRPRISQFFILPPHQKCGIGKKLLLAVYQHFRQQNNIKEFTGNKIKLYIMYLNGVNYFS